MIVCAVCHTENSHLAITCKRCGGFLQARIENLDLFSVAWKVLERPRKAFHIVAVAQHKNYSLLLSGIAGVGIVFFLFWSIEAGEYSESLINLMAAGFASGPLIGLLIVWSYAVCMRLISVFSNVRISLWQLYAVTSYALVPVVASVVFVLPIELMTFGLYFFTKNPSPYLLKPLSYVIMLILDGGFALWAFILLLVGTKTLFNGGWWMTIVRVLIAVAIVVGSVVVVLVQVVPRR